MIRTSLLILAALYLGARALQPVPIDLDGLADDAPRWLAELTERNA